VTKENEDSIAFLVDYLRQLNIMGLTFSFYVPSKNDKTGLKWNDLKERDEVVRKVMEIKKKNPDFIRNRGRSLELMLSENAKAITDNCPSKKMVLPLYLEKNEFKIPFCCYGNDVDCDLCGAWVVFHLAAAIEQRGLEKKGE
jgi:hypothetical protein